ncbi:MAG TPA: response regulator [Microvirga sp.]|jgi:CheY-like chemotaxis protein|nr:response regulator [Microvirga sp.]
MNKPITVLVVEDEPVTLEILTRYLRRADFTVLTARTGEEALALLRSEGHAIDWLFADIELPGTVDGWVVGAEFHLSYPLRPVVYASTFAKDSLARAAGTICLSKPYSPQHVVEIFRDLSRGAEGGSAGEALSIVSRAAAEREPDAAVDESDDGFQAAGEPPAPGTEAGPNELRGIARSRAVLRGRIVFNNRFSTMDCVVRDISPIGARLQLAGGEMLPPVFELSLPLRSRRHQAEIVWRRGMECGVRFIA